MFFVNIVRVITYINVRGEESRGEVGCTALTGEVGNAYKSSLAKSDLDIDG
jgi:hypothetical protein